MKMLRWDDRNILMHIIYSYIHKAGMREAEKLNIFQNNFRNGSSDDPIRDTNTVCIPSQLFQHQHLLSLFIPFQAVYTASVAL